MAENFDSLIGINKSDGIMIAERFINTFSTEWKEFIRIFFLVEDPHIAASKWMHKQSARMERLGPSNGWASGLGWSQSSESTRLWPAWRSWWHNLVDDLIEEVPIVSGNDIKTRSRVLCMPGLPQRNLLTFMNKSRGVDQNAAKKMKTFLMKNLHEFDEWSKFVILNCLVSSCKENYNIDETASFTVGKVEGSKPRETVKNYIDELKRHHNVSDVFKHWKLDNDVVEAPLDFTEKQRSLKINKQADVGRESRDLENKEENLKATFLLERAGSSQKKPRIELEEKASFESLKQNEMAGGQESVNDQNGAKPMDSLKWIPFIQLIKKHTDSRLICTELNDVISASLSEVHQICDKLEVKMLTEEHLLFFTNCLCSDIIKITSNAKVVILEESLLTYLVSLKKTATRQVFNCLIGLLKSNENELFKAVIVPLVLHSFEKSPQEELLLRILKAGSFNDQCYNALLQATFEVCSKEQEVSGSFIKFSEMVLRKQLPLSTKQLSDIIRILHWNSTKFQGSVELPKLIILMTKLRKKEAIGIRKQLESLVLTNKTFLKKAALKELRTTLNL